MFKWVCLKWLKITETLKKKKKTVGTSLLALAQYLRSVSTNFTQVYSSMFNYNQ